MLPVPQGGPVEGQFIRDYQKIIPQVNQPGHFLVIIRVGARLIGKSERRVCPHLKTEVRRASKRSDKPAFSASGKHARGSPMESMARRAYFITGACARAKIVDEVHTNGCSSISVRCPCTGFASRRRNVHFVSLPKR
jgi:hypothetical protein